MKNNFLLNSKTATFLYQSVKDLPIIDYHNHLSLDDIKNNKRFFDVYDLWINPDPYKHRAMRMCGIEEKYITGDSTPKEKFIKWCEVLPKLLGNPLHHWSLMELETVFGITEPPCEKNAGNIYKHCNEYLKNNLITAHSLLEKFNVEFACPCASLIDNISAFDTNGKIAPSLRGDDIVNHNEFFEAELSKITGINITDYSSFEKAVRLRLDQFEKSGLKFTDHALDNGFAFKKSDDKFAPSRILEFLATEYSKRDLVMQLHIGAQRYTSTKLRNKAGAAGGFAAIGNSVNVNALTAFLDTVDMGEHGLPKTILFPLNPADNALISTLSGSYSKDGIAGLITQGPAWWWCDHKLGMADILENTSAFSVLSNFIGMTTDSRSFLSFVRHDYFRLVLCDWVGKKAENGEFTATEDQLKELVYKLCYGNAKAIIKKRNKYEF